MNMSKKLVKSPLHDWHVQSGATIMWDDFYPWTLIHGDDFLKEYHAVRNGTGLLDLFSLFVFDVTGDDAEKFIQRTFTNFVGGMDIGQSRYGAFVNHRGILMDEGSIYKRGEEHYTIMANGPNLEWQMKEYATDLNASIINITNMRSTIGVQGPTSLETLKPLLNKDISQLKFFRFEENDLSIAGYPCWISRTGYSGERGYEVHVSPENATHVWEALIEQGGVPFGVYAIEVLRVEAGLPLIYIDYRLNDISPWDLSMDRFIKLHPDNVGTIALREYQQEMPYRFKTILIQGEELPDFHTGVYAGKEPIGIVTSPAKSPLCGSIALAILETSHAKDGNLVQVTIDGKFVNAEVRPLSIFDPDKTRIRK